MKRTKPAARRATPEKGRYGLGASARRSDGDAEGACGRGSSGTREIGEDEGDRFSPRGVDEGSRHGHTRTTGTAGGPRSRG